MDESGNFSIEYTPGIYEAQNVVGDIEIHAAMAFDSSNNFTLYELEKIILKFSEIDIKLIYNPHNRLILLEQLFLQICKYDFIN